MAALITDPNLESRLRAERELSGADRYDEVWDGIYMMAPLANDEHQEIVGAMTAILQAVVAWQGLGLVRPGVNVSDRDEGSEHNYRCPDVVVFLNGMAARNRDAHWVGGPDLAVEVVSSHDRSREKLPFYASVGVREVLVIDRDPWALELHRLTGETLMLAGRTTLADARTLDSRVVPLAFSLTPGTARPTILVTQRDSASRWNI